MNFYHLGSNRQKVKLENFIPQVVIHICPTVKSQISEINFEIQSVENNLRENPNSGYYFCIRIKFSENLMNHESRIINFVLDKLLPAI